MKPSYVFFSKNTVLLLNIKLDKLDPVIFEIIFNLNDPVKNNFFKTSKFYYYVSYLYICNRTKVKHDCIQVFIETAFFF